jgi:hypothetical protein
MDTPATKASFPDGHESIHDKPSQVKMQRAAMDARLIWPDRAINLSRFMRPCSCSFEAPYDYSNTPADVKNPSGADRF